MLDEVIWINVHEAVCLVSLLFLENMHHNKKYVIRNLMRYKSNIGTVMKSRQACELPVKLCVNPKISLTEIALKKTLCFDQHGRKPSNCYIKVHAKAYIQFFLTQIREKTKYERAWQQQPRSRISPDTEVRNIMGSKGMGGTRPRTTLRSPMGRDLTSPGKGASQYY